MHRAVPEVAVTVVTVQARAEPRERRRRRRWRAGAAGGGGGGGGASLAMSGFLREAGVGQSGRPARSTPRLGGLPRQDPGLAAVPVAVVTVPRFTG